jgi:DNA polymerase
MSRMTRNSLFAIDFSQVEYRILCGLAGQQDKLDALDSGRDLYCETAAALFKHPVTKAENPVERQFAKKECILSCGYGKGKDKAATQAKAAGYDFPREVTDGSVDYYRRTHPAVVKFWGRCDAILPYIADGGKCHLEGTPLTFSNEYLVLPNGLKCRFELVWCPEVKSWFRKVYRGGLAEPNDSVDQLRAKGYTKYWGGGLTEFCCQALSRIRLSELMLFAHRELGMRPVFLVHDEYVGIAPDDECDWLLERMLEFSRLPSPWWLDGPPFDAEGLVMKRYAH